MWGTICDNVAEAADNVDEPAAEDATLIEVANNHILEFYFERKREWEAICDNVAEAADNVDEPAAEAATLIEVANNHILEFFSERKREWG